MKKGSSGGIIIIKILVYVILILVPVIVYYFVGIPIPVESATNKDWLAFWGSFAGGCFGGIATLFTVIVTINQNKELKKQLRHSRKPRIYIEEKDFYINALSSMCDMYEFVEGKEEDYHGLIPLTFSNSGNESAFDIHIEWIKPDIELIKKSAELNSDDREIYFKVLELLKDSGQAKRKLNYINNCNKGEIVMHNYFGFFIQQLCKEMNLKFKNTKAPINVKYNMPLGVFKVNFKNSYEDVYLNFYKTEMSLLERNKSKSEYYVNISFDLINVSV